MKNSKLSPRKIAVADLFTITDKLDDMYERTLAIHIHGEEGDTPCVYMLVNNPYDWNVKKDGPVPLYLHQIEAAENDEMAKAFLPTAMSYLRKYARDRGYRSIFCRGKSHSISEEDMENFLIQCGFDDAGYRKYWLDL